MTAAAFRPQGALFPLGSAPVVTPKPAPVAPKRPVSVATSAVQQQQLLLLAPAKSKTVIVPERELWPHQQDVLDRSREVFNTHNAVLVVIPTGGGKTGVMAAAAAGSFGKKRQVLITVPSLQLIDQTIPELVLAGIPEDQIGIIRPEKYMDAGQEKAVYIGCIDSVSIWAEGQGSARHRLDLSKIRLILIDEAHHSCDDRYNCLFRAGARIVGYTATPIKNKKGRQLGDRYPAVIVGPSMGELIGTGHTLQPTYFQADSIVSDELLKSAELESGEYDQDIIAAGIEARRGTVYGQIVETYLSHGEDRPALVFAPSIAISRGIVQQFQAAGFGSAVAHIDGTISKTKRQELLEQFRAGRIQILSSVECFREGFDAPTAGVLLDCNPVRSLTRHLQALGRVVRAANAKTDCIVLDLVGNLLRHGLAEQPQEWNLPGWTLPTGKPQTEPGERGPRATPTRPYVCPHCPEGTRPVKFEVIRPVEFAGVGPLMVISGERRVMAPGGRILSVPPERCPSQHAIWGDALPLDCQACEVHSTHTDGSRICPSCGHKNLPEVRQDAENARELESGMVQITDGKIVGALKDAKTSKAGPSEAQMRLWLGSLRGAVTTMRKKDGSSYHPNWAHHAFEEKFKVSPQAAGVADTRPCRVAPEVASWIKAQDIRRAAAARGKARKEKLAAAKALAEAAAAALPEPEPLLEPEPVETQQHLINAAD